MVYLPAILNFSRYSMAQFMEILKEKVGIFKCIPEELLWQIASKVSQSRGTVPDAIRFLVIAVRTAIEKRARYCRSAAPGDRRTATRVW
jgi:hypothetical protein